LNLLSNALKFTEYGWINIRATIDDEFLEISVKDTGIGISEENKKKLFRLFGFINETNSRNINGIGLGLVISDKLVT
jgi:signal transduction histidine kinase